MGLGRQSRHDAMAETEIWCLQKVTYNTFLSQLYEADTLMQNSVHIYHFDMSSLAVWQDTCHTYRNLVYDLVHHESSVAQCLECPTGILEGYEFDSRWELRKFCFWTYRLENASPLFILCLSHQYIDHLFTTGLMLYSFRLCLKYLRSSLSCLPMYPLFVVMIF